MLVVFEGIDGSGKTIVSNQVAAALQARGAAVTHLRAGGQFKSTVAQAIRELGRDARNLDLAPEAEFLLYVARDVQSIEEVLRPALASGDLVIADRFLYTAEVLARRGRHLPEAVTAPVLRAAAGELLPDLVVLIDVDPALARARRKAAKLAADDRRPPARKGLAGVGLQHRLRRGYHELAAAEPRRWVVVPNEAPLAEVVAGVAALIDDARRGDVPAAIERFRGRTPAPAAARPVCSVEEALARFLERLDARAGSEPQVAAYLLGGLAGGAVDRLRRSLAAAAPKAVLAACAGMDDAFSWALRDELCARRPKAVALSLTGLPASSASAAAMRRSLAGAAPAEVALSLAAVDGDEAFELRESLFGAAPDAVMASLGGVAGARAWELRDRWMASFGADVTSRYPAAWACARGVTGVDDDPAWALRQQAREAAPVAALASLAGATSARAWQWRQAALARAPKIVMSTLLAMTDDRAWQMRAAVAADCKEALDSVLALDDGRAWALRDDHCDRWPSTVVKSLGPLALQPRGRALVERQLARYPQDLSLLKHAAAIALGLHGAAAPSGE